MTKFKVILFFIVLLFSGHFTYAQSADAEAVLMKIEMKIGEQVELKLAVRYQEGSKKSVVTWPEFKDTLSRGLEIIKADSIKTILANRASVLYEQSRSLFITAFDSGYYLIPAQKFIVNTDTIETQAQFIHVVSVPVDTTKPIRDIKDIYNVPDAPVVDETKSSNHLWWWIGGGIILLGIIAFVFYRMRKNKNVPILPAFTKTLLPHEKVLEQLAELGRKQPWMHGELKSYHMALTEILRAWIVDRYKIHAKEMTTGEIIYTLNNKRVDASAVMQLERVLRTADMVKFAKGIPLNEENENVLQLAMNFVQATAMIPEPPKPIEQ